MNTLKVNLVKILKSFNSIAYSKQKAKKEEEPVFMTLEEALQDSTLVKKMHSQLTKVNLTIGSSNNYVAGLMFNSHQYYILGTLREWESFFVMRH
ncbi:MAG: hypothetical protein JW731_03040 [Bacteroidales bacterium]|nr:hypothetical protein [Bacteroidales bacterium]